MVVSCFRSVGIEDMDVQTPIPEIEAVDSGFKERNRLGICQAGDGQTACKQERERQIPFPVVSSPLWRIRPPAKAASAMSSLGLSVPLYVLRSSMICETEVLTSSCGKS
jgi:hypothetical protein